MESIIDKLQKLIPWLEQSHEQPKGVSGLPTGFTAMNKLNAGWQQGELTVIAAPPRMGKTAFALSVLNNSMFDSSLGAFWFSTNLSANQLTNMLLCNNQNINMHSLLSGDVDTGQLKDIVEKIRFAGVAFDDSPYLTINDIETKLSEFADACTNAIVIIDNVNQLNYLESDRLELTDKLYQLKTLARKYEVPIICLLDTDILRSNFEVYEDCISELEQNKIFDSCIDALIQIFRPEYYKITEFEDGSSCLGFAELIVSGRGVMNDTALLKYNPLVFKFSHTNIVKSSPVWIH